MTLRRLRRYLSALLVFSMFGASVPAAAAEDGATPRSVSVQPILDQALETAAFEAMMQRGGSQRARRSNPYGTMSIVLMGGGGVMTIYGLAYPTGVKCDFGSSDFGCETTRSKVLIFGGLGAIGAGVWLYMQGERQRNILPSIAFDGRTFVASKRWSF